MRGLLVLFLISGVFLLCAGEAFTCGDKFVVVGRGMRYERAYAAVHPASILIYANDVKLTKELETTLKKSGHKIQTVPDETKLFSSLQSSKFDVVLVNLANVSSLEAKVMATPSKPAVLPVIYNATGMELDAAKKKYICVLKYGNKNKNAISVIDDVMEAKKKGKPLACKWSK